MNKIVKINKKAFARGISSGLASFSNVSIHPRRVIVTRDGGSVEKAWSDVGKAIRSSTESEFQKIDQSNRSARRTRTSA